MSKISRKNCCGLDVHKTYIYACIGITDPNGLTKYKQARFSSFSKNLREMSDWLAKYNCTEVCMGSNGKYWIPVFNILEKAYFVTLSHPKYTKPHKGNKTDRKDAKWICNLFMCDMIKSNFIPSPEIRQLCNLMRYRFKLTNMFTSEKNWTQNCLTVSNPIARMMLTSIYHKLSKNEDFHPDDYEATVNSPKQKPVILTLDNILQFLREQGASPKTLKLIQQQCTAQVS